MKKLHKIAPSNQKFFVEWNQLFKESETESLVQTDWFEMKARFLCTERDLIDWTISKTLFGENNLKVYKN